MCQHAIALNLLENAMEIESGRDVLNQAWSICESMFEDIL